MLYIYCQLVCDGQPVSSQLAKVEQIKVKKISYNIIVELQAERAWLDIIEEFPGQLFQHYYKPSSSQPRSAGIVEAAELRTARSKVMIAIGRTLWKLGDPLVKFKSAHSDTHSSIASEAIPIARLNVGAQVMHNRLARIESEFREYLLKARVFSPLDLPEVINRFIDMKKYITGRGTKQPASSQSLPSLPSNPVRIARDGSVRAEQTLDHVLQRLGLQGNGIGGRVGLRCLTLLVGLEGASFAKELIVKSWNLPDVTVDVAIDMPDQPRVTKEWLVNVDDLIPATASSQQQVYGHPIDIHVQENMLYVPDQKDYILFRRWASSQLQCLLLQGAASQPGYGQDVEVCLVSPEDSKNVQVPRA